MSESTEQLSLFSGTSIAPDAKPPEPYLETARNRAYLVKIYLNSVAHQKGHKTEIMRELVKKHNNGDYAEILKALGRLHPELTAEFRYVEALPFTPNGKRTRFTSELEVSNDARNLRFIPSAL